MRNEKWLGFDFPKNNMVSMSSNIPKNDSNFFHRMFDNFTIDFIVFMTNSSKEKKLPL